MISVVDADALCWYPAPAQKSVHHKCNSEAAGVALIEYISVSLAIVQISDFSFQELSEFQIESHAALLQLLPSPSQL